MSRRLLLGLVALGIGAMTPMSAPAQLGARGQAAAAINQATALSDRIRGYHVGPASWRGSGPPPPGYCATMRAGEAALQELARLANQAVSDRLIGLAQALERAADRLSDQLDAEEVINFAAGIAYTDYPCPAVMSAYPERAIVLAVIDRRAPACRRVAHARLLSFNARRVFMWECLRL